MTQNGKERGTEPTVSRQVREAEETLAREMTERETKEDERKIERERESTRLLGGVGFISLRERLFESRGLSTRDAASFLLNVASAKQLDGIAP